MTPWTSAVLPILIGISVLTVPGLLSLLILGVRGLPLLGLSGPVSVAIIGGSAVLAAMVGLRFTPLVPALGTLATIALALTVRRWTPPVYRRGPRRELVVIVPMVMATIVAAFIAFGSVASPALVSQTYDGVFHVNAVSWILERGDASSFHLYRLTHPGDGIEFYPAAWHATAALVVQMTGTPVATATVATWIASTGAVLVPGSALLATTVVGPRRRLLVATTAAVAATASAAGPYLLLKWGVLYPTGLAYALIPAGLALLVIALRDLGRRRFWFSAALVLVWLGGSGLAHPRSLVSFALLALPLLIATAVTRARRGLSDPSTRRRTLVIMIASAVGIAVFALIGSYTVLRYFRADVRPIAERLNGGPATARQSFGESLLQAMTLTPPSGPGESMLPIGFVLAFATLVGLTIAIIVPRTRWIAGAFLLTALLYALAAGSNSDFAKLSTGFWYKDKYRLFALLGLMAPLLIALVAAVVADWSRRGRLADRRPRLAALVAPLLIAVVVVSGWLGPTLAAMRESISMDWTVASAKDGRMLDASEFDLLSRLSEYVPPGAVIAGNPWDGSSLSWALGGREALFPHLTGQWDPDRVTVATRLDAIATDPEVCAALGRLGVDYVLASQGLLWGGDPAAAFYDPIGRATTGPGMDLVASEGSTRLFRITACG